MNTKEKALLQLNEFMESDERVVLITGTHQYEKHRLALQVINSYSSSDKVLFRVNALDNLGSIFQNHSLNHKAGKTYKLGDNVLHIDSINERSWSKTPHSINSAVLYPLDSPTRDIKKRKDIVEDLLDRQAEKVFLVSWTDTHDFSWVNEYIDRHVIYDAEEEDPAYHQRVVDIINKRF